MIVYIKSIILLLSISFFIHCACCDSNCKKEKPGLKSTKCNEDYKHPDFYYNRSGIIIKMSDKFATVKKVLIQDNLDSTLHIELSTKGNYDYCKDKDLSNYKNGICNPDIIDSEWFYNHKVGDLVSFKFIKKNRYFHIYTKKDKIEESKDVLDIVNDIKKENKTIKDKFKLSDD